MSCPKCKNGVVQSDMTVICSNDCGTIYCSLHGAYYENMSGKIKMGHSPICGNFEKMEKYTEKKNKEKLIELDSDKYKC